MKIPALLALAVFLLPQGGAQTSSPVSAEDEAAIKKPAMNYIEGYYEGDGARMESALHPDLVKRLISTGQNGQNGLETMSAMTLVQRTRAGGGKKIPKERQQKDITILDRYNNVAVVRIVASDWIDYLQEGKWNGEWKIINVLWELKPKPPGNQQQK